MRTKSSVKIKLNKIIRDEIKKLIIIKISRTVFDIKTKSN